MKVLRWQEASLESSKGFYMGSRTFLKSLRHPYPEIRRPPLRGPPGCEASLCNPVSNVPCILCTLFSVSRFPVSVSGSLESGFRDPGLFVTRDPPATNYHQPRGCFGSGLPTESLWKVSKFQASLQANKRYENWSHGIQNHKKMTLGTWEISFCKSCFLQYLPCQLLDFPIPNAQIQTPKSSEKVTWK